MTKEVGEIEALLNDAIGFALQDARGVYGAVVKHEEAWNAALQRIRAIAAAPRADATAGGVTEAMVVRLLGAAAAVANNAHRWNGSDHVVTSYLIHELRAAVDATYDAALRAAQPKTSNTFVGEPITATDWHAKAQQLAEENADLREQIDAFMNQPIKAWAVVRDDDNDVVLFVPKDEADAAHWASEGATTRPLVFAAQPEQNGGAK